MKQLACKPSAGLHGLTWSSKTPGVSCSNCGPHCLARLFAIQTKEPPQKWNSTAGGFVSKCGILWYTPNESTREFLWGKTDDHPWLSPASLKFPHFEVVQTRPSQRTTNHIAEKTSAVWKTSAEKRQRISSRGFHSRGPSRLPRFRRYQGMNWGPFYLQSNSSSGSWYINMI